jgi:hypothetical protein
MKNIIPSVCMTLALAGCQAIDQQNRMADALDDEYYRIEALKPSAPQREITATERALKQRQALARQNKLVSRYDVTSYQSSQVVGFPQSGTMIVGTTGLQPSSTSLAPLNSASVPYTSSTLPPVGEAPSVSTPVAQRVPGRPGYVFSPFAPNSGFVDVSGLPSGIEARDPYTGRVFRVP